SVRPREQVGNWLYGVAYRTALKARGGLARRRSREKQVDIMPEPPAKHMQADWADLQPLIDEELAKLPQKLRGPVVLCDIEGRSQREVAKQLGVPPATLATRLAAARRTLAQRLTKRGVTLSGGAVAGLLTIHGSASAVPHALAHGLTRAAEAVATGGAVASLVSASAVQLSEGVMRMMLLTKLKTVAVATITAIALTGGMGLGLVPARAGGTGDDSAPAAATAKIVPGNTALAEDLQVDLDRHIEVQFDGVAADSVDDATFLRRLSLDIRGTVPTDIETYFFIDDQDENKRAKLVEWLVGDDAAREFAAAQLGVDAKRVRVARVVAGKDGKPATIVLVIDAGDETKAKPKAVAFSPDGKKLAIELQQDHPAGAREKKTIELKVQTDPRRVEERVIEVHGTAIDGGGDSFWLELGDDAKGIVQLIQEHGEKGPEHGKGTVLLGAKDGKVYRVVVGGQADGKGKSVTVTGKVDGETKLLTVTGQGGEARRVVVSGQGGGEEKRLHVTGQDGTLRLWDVKDGKTALWTQATKSLGRESDADFLNRAVKAARGREPSALEKKYFTEDKDPKKREKLLDALLKEPEVQKKLGDDFKKRMLAGAQTFQYQKGLFDLHLVPGGKQGEFKILPDIEGRKFEYKVQPKIENKQLEFKIQPKVDGKQFEFKLDPKNFQGGGQEFKLDLDDLKKKFPGLVVPSKDGKEWKFEFKELKDLKDLKDFKALQGLKEMKGLNFTIPANPATPKQPATPRTPATPSVKLPPKPPVPPTPSHAATEKLEKLVAVLIAAKKTDAEILEAVTLATSSRLPTDLEKKLTLALVAKSADRKAAWIEVAKVLAGAGKTDTEKPVRVRLNVKEDVSKPAK
ncbi:MAG TPA: DUF1549 domain-containing protein, partial [Gemmata sp.]|nr:DUF1549 domain-containing protein [Gemmata sp.]